MAEGPGGGGTASDRLIAAKASAAALRAEVAAREAQARAQRALARDAAGAAKAAEKDARALAGAADRAAGVAAERARALAALGFDARGEEALKARRDALCARAAEASDAYEAEAAALAPAVELSYEAGGLGRDWDPARVRGTVAQLVSVTRADAAAALEAVAGGALFSAVVDSEATAKALIEGGRLKKRANFLPLTQVRGGTLSAERVAHARSVSGGRAVPAMELLRFDPALAKAVEHVFGSAFVCDTAEVAQAVCYDPKVMARCVTLAGDSYDPRGTLEGGSAPAGERAGGAPLLARTTALRARGEELATLRRELGGLEAPLGALAKGG
jgi:structural maintenance of chromosome 2